MIRISISEIKRINKESGGFFFSPGAMEFFNSKVHGDAYSGPGGIFFVTSEQYTTEGDARHYTVREFTYEGNVHSATHLRYTNLAAARRVAEHYAEYGK